MWVPFYSCTFWLTGKSNAITGWNESTHHSLTPPRHISFLLKIITFRLSRRIWKGNLGSRALSLWTWLFKVPVLFIATFCGDHMTFQFIIILEIWYCHIFYTLLLLHICVYFLNAKIWTVISHYHWLVSGWFQCSLSLDFLSEKERSDVNSLAAWENVKTPCLLPTPPLYQAFKANAGKSAMGVPSTEHALCYPASQKRSTNSYHRGWKLPSVSGLVPTQLSATLGTTDEVKCHCQMTLSQTRGARASHW